MEIRRRDNIIDVYIEASILFNILSKLESNYLLLSLKAFNAIKTLLSKLNVKHVIVIKVSLLLKSLIKSTSTLKSQRLLLQ